MTTKSSAAFESPQAGKAETALETMEQEIPIDQLRELLSDKEQEFTPLSNQEKRELLKSEALAELSTEEYISLWRRLNPHFLSHVTRQGFRDHNGMNNHSSGIEDFHNGFTSVLEDDKLIRPPLAVSGDLRSRDEETIKKFLEKKVFQAENEYDALDALATELHKRRAAAPRYPDKTAVHFAAQMVADDFYGGEMGNEIFFLYPSDFIASQHDFAMHGGKQSLVEKERDEQWNDVFVWPETLDNTGIKVDAGLAFLPKNTLVDPETGSKYASEIKDVDGIEKRVMIENKELIATFSKWREGLNDQSPTMISFKEFSDFMAEQNQKTSFFRDSQSEQDKERECRDVCRQEMLGLGFDDDAANRLSNLLFSRLLYRFIDSKKFYIEYHTKEEADYAALLEAGANWEKARNPVTSEEYWERKFKENEKLRPKHVVYYDGDPTIAILSFQQENNIGRADVSKKEGVRLGFDDHYIEDMEEDPRSNRGYDELTTIAEKMIAEHYQLQAAREKIK